MPRASSLEKLTLRDLKEEFHLQTSGDPNFFLEWQQNLPVISEWEHQRLDRIYAIYENFNEDSVLEEKLKITIVSPLLDLADFFLPPFQFSAEEQVQISMKDEKKTYRGKIDFLVLQDQLWLLIIESKRQAFSLSVGIPQVLTYMLGHVLSHPINQSNVNLQTNPQVNPLYGMVTNGSNFVFLKMMLLDGIPVYAKSDEFLLEKKTDRACILQILKQIGRSIQV